MSDDLIFLSHIWSIEMSTGCKMYCVLYSFYTNTEFYTIIKIQLSELHCETYWWIWFFLTVYVFVCSGKCVQKRPAPLSASDSSFYRQSSNNRRNGSMAMPTQKPLRERIIHLLALKPYRKPELLLWLERERVSPKDKAELGAILEEVRRNNVHASSMHTHINAYR